ncbi:DUF4390 domain-containing protein [Ideonella sp. DXS29W]|uniref:DUF4390 domain-containing protein n=1 Tax=Ideonella lacteola TaxID=2984193 RepID=A0ABU9BL33_9BURK
MNRAATAFAPAAHRVIRAVVGVLWLWAAMLAGPARADGSIELTTFDVSRSDGLVLVDFVAKPVLSKAVEDAMQRGVPVYFVAQAALYRSRWYWRDERVARVTRTWRLSYQPLTSNWRLGFGTLSQSYATAEEALDMAARASRWKLAETDQLEPGEKYYVEFSYRLDNNQLPRPMQLDLAAQADWQLSAERKVKLEP